MNIQLLQKILFALIETYGYDNAIEDFENLLDMFNQ